MRPGRLCPTSLQGNASKPDRKMGPNQHALGFPYFLPPSPLLHTPLILLDNSKGFCTAPPAHTDLPLGCRESSRGKERGAHAQPSSTALIPLSFLSLTEQMDPPTPRQCAALSLQHSVFALWVTLCPLCWAGPCYQISFSFQVYLNRDFRAGKAVRCMLTRRRAGGGGGGGRLSAGLFCLGGCLALSALGSEVLQDGLHSAPASPCSHRVTSVGWRWGNRCHGEITALQPFTLGRSEQSHAAAPQPCVPLCPLRSKSFKLWLSFSSPQQ